MGKSIYLWLRWSWRDLKQRWLQVLAIALIIALGTGTYAGLVSTTPWRQNANDKSYALLNMYDLRLSLTEGSYLDSATVLEAIRQIEHTNWIQALEPRMILPTLVDVSTDGQTIIIPGRLVGSDISEGEIHVNDLHITAGRRLNEGDIGRPVAILEHKFAEHYALPSDGEMTLSGNQNLSYVGTGLSPEYFMVFTDEGGMMAEANFAVVFTSLQTVQTLGEHPGMLNDLLFMLDPEADLELIQDEIETAVRSVSEVGLAFMLPADDPAYNMLYEDIKQDEIFWRWMAYIFLLGAVFGAFNLATRLVEAQRREIGIQMALGLPSYKIAIRPLLVALQIAALGVVFGLIIGWLLGEAFGVLMQEMIPLPVFEMPFQPGAFAESVALGITLPMLATLIPVVRALRVEPVDAIKTGHLVAKGGGLAPLLKAGWFARSVLGQMPLRNLLLAPRRALLTLLGIAAAITLLILIMGVLDSFDATLDEARLELLQDSTERVIVKLNFFYPTDSSVISNIQQSPALGDSEPILQIGGYLMHESHQVETMLDIINMDSTLWHPTVSTGSVPGDEPAVLISELAAKELGVKAGDRITLRHPLRTSLFAYDWAESEIIVSGTHPMPMRFLTYMDLRHADLMGLAGVANALHVEPAAGYSQDQVKRALFGLTGVASVQPIAAMIDVFEDLIAEFVEVFSVMQGAAIAMAILIAYNSTSINLDERAREMATLFAFGVRIRSALRVAIVENLLTSIVGTVVGCLAGFFILAYTFTQMFAEVAPDIGITVTIDLPTFIAALLVGVLVAVLTPLLSLRKMLHMDIPSTLRVME